MEELRKKMKISQNESEIITLDIQIQSLTNKLNYCRFDLRDSASFHHDFFFLSN